MTSTDQPPRFPQLRTESQRLQHIEQLVPGIRSRANTLGSGIAGSELRHIADLLEGILNDHTTAPVVQQAEHERAEREREERGES